MRFPVPRRFALPVLAAALIVLAALLPRPSVPDDRTTAVAVESTSYTCPAWEGLTLHAGQVNEGAKAEAVTLPETSAVPELDDATSWRTAAPRDEAIVVRQSGEGSGAAGFVLGTAAGRGDGLATTKCPAITDDAWFSGLGAVEGHDSQLVVANPGDEEAVVALGAWSGVGEVEIPEGDGIALAPGEVRRYAASDLAAGENLLTVRVARKRGVAVAAVLDSGSGPVRGSEASSGAPPPTRDFMLAGIPGDAERRLILTNPGDTTANVEVSIVSADGTFVAEGLDDVSIEPATVREIPVAGDAPAGVAVRLRSNEPITGLLRSQGAEDFADSQPLSALRPGAALVPILDDTQVTAAAKNADTTAEIEVFDAQMKSLGSSELSLTAGSSTSIALNEVAEGGAYAILRSEGVTYAAAWYVSGGRIASLPLAVAPVDVLAPAASWGGRWH